MAVDRIIKARLQEEEEHIQIRQLSGVHNQTGSLSLFILKNLDNDICRNMRLPYKII